MSIGMMEAYEDPGLSLNLAQQSDISKPNSLAVR